MAGASKESVQKGRRRVGLLPTKMVVEYFVEPTHTHGRLETYNDLEHLYQGFGCSHVPFGAQPHSAWRGRGIPRCV